MRRAPHQIAPVGQRSSGGPWEATSGLAGLSRNGLRGLVSNLHRLFRYAPSEVDDLVQVIPSQVALNGGEARERPAAREVRHPFRIRAEPLLNEVEPFPRHVLETSDQDRARFGNGLK